MPTRNELKKEVSARDPGPACGRVNFPGGAINMPNLAPPIFSSKYRNFFGERENHTYEEIRDTPLSNPRSRLAAPFVPIHRGLPKGCNSGPVDWVPPPRHEQEHDEDDDVDFGATEYLGPRFPSLGPPGTEKRDYKAEVDNLHQLVNEELTNVHRLEGDIAVEIYGNRDILAPCSLLDNPDVVAATSYPLLLSRDAKTQVQVMRDVLILMEKTKSHDKKVLKQLQEGPQEEPQEEPQHQSDRLRSKPRKDYKMFNRFGY